MPTGKVVRINLERGFGFVKNDAGGNDCFFHVSRIKEMDFDETLIGRRVEFEAIFNPEKGPAAVYVKPIGGAA